MKVELTSSWIDWNCFFRLVPREDPMAATVDIGGCG